MQTYDRITRRCFVATTLVAPLTIPAKNRIPVGLELYSVRERLKTDLKGTLQSVAKMGYECVEFYSPYYEWTAEYAKQVRVQLDSVGLKCYSTHNSMASFSPKGLPRAVELNGILGSKYIVCAHPGKVSTLADWNALAEILNVASQSVQRDKLHIGYHNHDLEWRPVDGQIPMEILAAKTDKSIMLQLDVGTSLEVGRDPVAWINSHPGRIRSLHLKDWSPQEGYKVLFGEGIAPWKQIFAAAEKKGGVEYYLIEQEGSRFPELETVSRCMADYREVRHT